MRDLGPCTTVARPCVDSLTAHDACGYLIAVGVWVVGVCLIALRARLHARMHPAHRTVTLDDLVDIAPGQRVGLPYLVLLPTLDPGEHQPPLKS